MRVAALFAYPVKSCGALALERAHLGRAGLQGDRSHAFVGEDGRILTQRELPRLDSVRPVLEDARLQLDLGGLARVPALGGDRAVSEFLGVAVRLVAGRFPDVAPVLVATLASLEALNTRFSSNFAIESFRPNVVLAGSRPHEETGWAFLETAEARLECEAPCERCTVIGEAALRAVHEGLGGNFGVYCRVAREGSLRLGEAITPA